MPVNQFFPVNEVLTAEHAPTLKISVRKLGCPGNLVYVEDGASGPAVFYEHPAVNAGTRYACGIRSPSWLECQARAAVTVLLVRLSLKLSQEPA
jgi:hypothetical protein